MRSQNKMAKSQEIDYTELQFQKEKTIKVFSYDQSFIILGDLDTLNVIKTSHIKV